MPLAKVHLISLKPASSLKDILSAIRSAAKQFQPIILSKPIRWVILPESIDQESLLKPSRPWDLLYIHLGTDPLSDDITSHISDHYNLQVGIPSRLLKDFPTINRDLLHPLQPSSIPPLTGALDNPLVSQSSQDLSLSQDLQTWIASFAQTDTGRNAVSMLNLLAFHPDRKQSYIKYGQEFARSIGSKRGGNAKLVGNVVHPSPTDAKLSASPDSDPETEWEEFALAQYPSILHFADMLASQDYQDVNQKFRVPALRDTCILCTSEIAIEDLLRDSARSRL